MSQLRFHVRCRRAALGEIRRRDGDCDVPAQVIALSCTPLSPCYVFYLGIGRPPWIRLSCVSCTQPASHWHIYKGRGGGRLGGGVLSAVGMGCG